MAEQNDKRLFLLDAMALIYRAYYAFAYMRKTKGVGMMNSKGLETSAIFGFTNTLLELINKEAPTHIAVVFDTMAPTQRATDFDFYKANREEIPEDIARSLPYIKEIVKGFNIPVVELDGYEADDIIGTLAKRAEEDSYEVYMVTPDKDFGQLVSDKVFIYKPPYQGKGGFEKIGVTEVTEKWGIERVDQVIDILGLMGDAVDNIPGVPGVGEKTAAKLLAEFDNVENLLENTDQIKGKLREKIEEFEEQARISKQLATIITDVPIDVTEEELVMEEPDRQALAALFNELEFRTLGKRILGEDFTVTVEPTEGQMSLFNEGSSESTVAPPQQVDATEAMTVENTSHQYKTIQGEKALKDFATQLAKQKTFAFDTETTGLDPLLAELVGLSFSWKTGSGYFIPTPEDQKETQQIVDLLKPALEDPKILKVAQNGKYDALVLLKYGVRVSSPMFDTMVAHYLLEPDLRHNMDYLAETYLGYHPVSIEMLIGKKGKKQGSMRDVPVDKITEYAAEDADITWQLYEKFDPALGEQSVKKLFKDVEMPLVDVLVDVESAGVRLDVDFLNNYSKELAKDQGELRDSIYKMAGTEFNLESPKQLGQVLFELMKIPYKGKKTKTGQYSTNEDVLSRLADEYEIAKKILDYREIGKLKSTYVDVLPSLVNEKTGRLHTTYNQTVANTGRLSSQGPNLQNIPIRSERGRRVRKAFIPRDDQHVLLSADYSQVELRIIASLSGDANMIESFKKGEDIHTATAARVFGVKPEEVDRNMRSKAKAVNFGIAYGQTAFGLAQTLNISRTEAKEIIDHYFEQFPGIRKYMDEAVQFAKEHGYAKTLLNRRRFLKDINSGNQTVRGFAERNAINMPIQGTAADIIKIAMVKIHEVMQKKKFQAAMILQVHDELVFDVPKKELDDLTGLVVEHMQNAMKLEVPLLVETGSGKNWLEAH